MPSDTQKTTTSKRDMVIGAARQLIDLGAACQKARSFTAVTPQGLRSVYEDAGESLVKLLEGWGVQL